MDQAETLQLHLENCDACGAVCNSLEEEIGNLTVQIRKTGLPDEYEQEHACKVALELLAKLSPDGTLVSPLSAEATSEARQTERPTLFSLLTARLRALLTASH